MDIEPDALIGQLRDAAVTGCSVALAYHGARTLSPAHPSARLHEQRDSAVYFHATRARYRDAGLTPRVAHRADAVLAFCDVAARERFPVDAWLAICHDDTLGAEHPECTVENVFGDRYRYALCPSNPRVRTYAAALCADVAGQGIAARLDLEAVGHLGVTHDSMHQKHGIPLSPLAEWLLSLCVCNSCRARLPIDVTELRRLGRGAIDQALAAWPDPPPAASLRAQLDELLGSARVDAILAVRRQTILDLLADIRCGVPRDVQIDLRMTLDLLGHGGKTALSLADAAPLIDGASLTFMGLPLAALPAALARVPPRAERPIPLGGGLSFVWPDCSSAADVHTRVATIAAADFDHLRVHGFALASLRQRDWLRNALNAMD